MVPNYSFEIYDTCPSSVAQIQHAIPWFQPNTCCGSGGSTDYFNFCAGIPQIQIPQNMFGYQYAKTGNAYAGIATILPSFNNYREYLEVSLIDSMQVGKKYCITLYASLANTSKYASNNVGIYISNNIIQYSDINFSVLNYSPQINQNNIINDTLNWVLISGIFTANGGEKYITIGNFFDDSNTLIDTLTQSNDEAYYYIDDVSVYQCDTLQPTENNFFIPNAFSPNGDGQNDVLYVRGNNIQQIDLKVYNRWGEMVFETTDKTIGWDGTYKGKPCNTGVYVYMLSGTYTDGSGIKQNGNVSLIR